MPRKTPELDQDFNIYVDPSCVSEAMAEDTPATTMPTMEEKVPESAAPEDPAQDVAAEVAAEDTEVQEPDVTPTDEGAVETEELVDTAELDTSGTETKIVDEEVGDEEQADSAPHDDLAEDEPVAEHDDATELATEDDTLANEDFDEEPTTEQETEEHSQLEEMPKEPDLDEPKVETEEGLGAEITEEALGEAAGGELDEPDNFDATDASSETAEVDKEEVDDNKEPEVDDLHTDEQEASDTEQDQDRGPQRLGERKTSLRTEALIQAAARAVVAKIEKRKSGELPEPEDEFDQSMVSTDSQDTETRDRDDNDAFNAARDLLVNSLNDQHHDRPQSSSSQVRHTPSHSISSDDANDSSSQHEREDDLFSDRSARSSLCSPDPVSDPEHYEGGTIRGSSLSSNSIKTPHVKDAFAFSERRDSFASSTTSSQDHHLQPSHSSVHSDTISPARTVSNFSTISGLSAYDDSKQDGFVPTHRETRLPFRTPSEIRAMQMSSPTPSVFNGSAPSSRPGMGASKRYNGTNNNNGFSSPTASAQYSPKGRSTPTRLKSARKEAPLVLLHVTLLPLQWAWGDVLNGMDALVVSSESPSKTDLTAGESPSSSVSSVVTPPPSDQLKTLRDAWRELQSRVGDTVLERGILLPHPQNDYEVLEERLLEALELPLRRRARILECGHYVGPANVPDDEDEDISDDESLDRPDKRQWCATCETEIRVEDLGVGKVFRVKVYASNGLMRAGAWEACWKEMERVDVEVEPIVDGALQSELERLALLQDELEEQRRRELLEAERAAEIAADAEAKAMVEGLRANSRQQQQQQQDAQRSMMPSPAPSGMQLAMRTATPQPSAANTLVRAETPNAYPVDTSEERRMRDEERMREIYGDAPSHSEALTPDQQQHQQPQPQASQPQQQHHQQHYPPAQTQIPPTLPLLTDGRQEHAIAHQQPRSSRPLPLDENSGFVEVLMEAFKVLLRDPKNVAIIVLCVFVVFMIKRPSLEAQQQQQGVVHMPQVPQVHVSSQVPQGQAEQVQAQIQGVKQVPGLGDGGVAGYEVAGMGEKVVREVLGVESGVVAEEGAEETAKALLASETEVEGTAEQSVEVEVTEAEPVTEAQTEAEPEPETPVEQNDATLDTPAPVFILPDDMCAPRGLFYPITPIDELPPLTDLEGDNTEDNDDEDLQANCSPPSSTTTSSAIGPFVTQRRTVRLFETVTETVRVSVVTQTETVSTVVTAVPQTVEETVYETETVRITVSVPVEGQKQKQMEENDGCDGEKRKKGWF